MADNSNNSLAPEKIVNDFENGDINEKETLYLLKTLIESSENPRTRLKCIEILGSLNISSNEVFELLESCLLSDENHSVRELAARVLCEIYPDGCLAPLKWVVENERTTDILDIIYKLSDRVHDPQFSALLDKRISEHFGVIPQELPFLLDLRMFYNKTDSYMWREEYSLSRFHRLGRPDRHIHFYLGYHSLEPTYYVLNGRIIGLSASEAKILPTSIRMLSKLKYMSINSLDSLPCPITAFRRLKGLKIYKRDKLRLPDDIICLKSLQELSLGPSFFRPISKTLISLIEQNIAPKYVKRGVHPEDATSLGLLEAYFGSEILDYSMLDDVLQELIPNYEINEQGRVITFNILHGEDYMFKGPIPNPIFRFKFLEKLEIYDAGIFFVPYKIKRLKHLRKLILRANPIAIISNAIKDLTYLEELDLSISRLREFPEFIFQMPNLRIVGLECTEIPESVASSKLEQLEAKFEEFSIGTRKF